LSATKIKNIFFAGRAKKLSALCLAVETAISERQQPASHFFQSNSQVLFASSHLPVFDKTGTFLTILLTD
jgi:hypothetical protein